MSIQKFLLGLYPRTWRLRYEEEFLELLESRPLTFTDHLDILLAAIDAHLHPHFGMRNLPLHERLYLMLRTLRQSMLVLFASYIGFVLAGIVFGKMTEESIPAVMHASTLAGTSYTIISIGSIIALGAVLIGGLPIVLAVVKYAISSRRFGLLLWLAVPPLAFVLLMAVIKFPPPTRSTPAHLRFAAFFIGDAVVSTAAVCRAIACSRINPRLLRFATIPAIIATVAMLVMFIATLCWGLSLRAAAPSLFTNYYGFMGANTASLWLGVAIVMPLSTSIAFVALIRSTCTSDALNRAI